MGLLRAYFRVNALNAENLCYKTASTFYEINDDRLLVADCSS